MLVIFFTKNPNLKKMLGEEGGGGGGRWMDRRTGPNQFATYQPTIFFTKNPNLKKEDFFFWGGGDGGGSGVSGCGGGGGRGRWMDRGTVPNQFTPSTSSKLGGGHNYALMYKLCP